MIYLGIDPGLVKTGVGIISAEGQKLKYVGHKLIKTNAKEPLPERLTTLINGLDEVFKEYNPKVAAIEDVFVSQNPKSALLLGQARGALIATVMNNKIPMYEFTALQIKKAVTGYGKAEKEQVRRMIELQLRIQVNDKVQLDITDALGCAICVSQVHMHGVKF